MSDGATDGAKMQRQHADFESYLDRLIEWLHDPSVFTTYEAVLEAAKTAGRHYGAQLHESKRLTSSPQQLIEALRANNEEVWAEFLFSITQSGRSGKTRRIQLESLSPFAGKALVAVTRYDTGTTMIVLGSDFEEWLMKQLPKMRPDQAGTKQYAVVVDLPELRTSAVFEVK